MPVCSVCSKNLLRHRMCLTPSDAPSCVIILSCLARYHIELDSAKKLYKRWITKQTYVCSSHIVDVTLFLTLELQQILGEFPLSDLHQVPEDVENDFIAFIRMYGTLLGHGVCVEKKDVEDFYKINWTRCHNEILKKLKKGIAACAVKGPKKEVEDVAEDLISASARLESVEPSTSGGKISSTPSVSIDINTEGRVLGIPINQAKAKPDVKTEVDTTTSNEQSTRDEVVTSVMRLLNPSTAGVDSTSAGKRTSQTGPTCALCLTSPSEANLRDIVTREQQLLLISGLIMCKEIDLDVAFRLYMDNINKCVSYCREHFVKVAFCYGDKIRNVWGQFPVRDSTAPAEALAALLNQIKDVCAKIDAEVEFVCDDLAQFYFDCQSGYCEAEGNRVAPKPILCRKPTLSKVENTVNTEEKEKQKTNSANAGKEMVHRSINDRYFLCLICGSVDLQTESRLSPANHGDQNTILLCCLMLGYALPLDTAKTVYKEIMVKYKRSRLCRKHFIQAGAWLSEQIQNVWEGSPPSDLNEVPFAIRADVLNRIQECANLIENTPILSEHHLTQFYNDCNQRYRTEAGWSAIDVKEKAQRERALSVRGLSPSQETRFGKDFDYVPVEGLHEPLNKEHQELSDEHLRALHKTRCAICGKVNAIRSLRRVVEKSRFMRVLLSCLVMHNHIGQEAAADLFKENRSVEKRICQDHFTFVAEFLEAEYGKRTLGKCRRSSFRYCRKFKDDVFHRIAEIGKEFDGVDEVKRISLFNFWNYYRIIYKRKEHRHISGDEQVSEENDLEQDIDICGEAGNEEEMLISEDAKVPKSEPHDDSDLPIILNLTELEKEKLAGDEPKLRGQIKVEADQRSFFTTAQRTHSMITRKSSKRSISNCPQEPSVSAVNDNLYCVVPVDEPLFEASTSTGDVVEVNQDRECSNMSPEEFSFYTEFAATELLPGPSSSAKTGTCNGGDRSTAKSGRALKQEEEDARIDEIIENVSKGVASVPWPEPNAPTFDSTYLQFVQDSMISTSATAAKWSRVASEELRLITAICNADPNKSVAELASELGINRTTALSYIRNNFSGDPALDEAQLQSRLEISSSLALRNSREPFLSRVITYGEHVIHFESQKRVPNPPEGLTGPKVLLTVWWSASGLIMHQLVRRNLGTVSSDHFVSQLGNLQKTIREKHPELNVAPILLFENPRPHMTRETVMRIHQYGFELLPYPTNAKDLLPSYYYFFPRFLNHIRRKEYTSFHTLRHDFRMFAKSKLPMFYADGMYQLDSRWNRCIELNGHYVDL